MQETLVQTQIDLNKNKVQENQSLEPDVASNQANYEGYVMMKSILNGRPNQFYQETKMNP